MQRILPEISKLCRLCLTESVVYYSLLENDRAVVLESLTSIKIDEDDPLPKNACIKCCLSLKYAFQIQQNILESDRKLRLLDITFDNEESAETIKKSTENRDDVYTDEEHDIERLFASNSQDINERGGIAILEKDYDNAFRVKTEKNEVKDPDEPELDDEIVNDGVKTHCKICGLEFAEKELMEHMQYHYFSIVKCDECNMPCENIHSYRQHLLEEHKDVPTDKSWSCKVCQVSFLNKPLYIIHFKSAHVTKTQEPTVQTPGTYPCSYCKKSFYNEKRRDVHMAVHKKKQCDICGVYITPTNFPAHRKSHLEDEVECPICRRKYKNTVSLKGHIHYTHSQRTYVCEFCDKTFKKSYSLLLHIKREHTGEKSHVCDLCGKSFLTFYNLSKHKKMTHQKLRPFQCDYCQKKFSSKFALRTHERQHTLDAPFECDLCGQSFRQKVSLKSHRKSMHNIEEPLTCACEVCGKWFSNRFAVMSHMRLH